MAPPLLELRGVSKRFPGVLANDDVDFALHPGEVHVLLGENGAGKSTLLSLLGGLLRPDSGDILLAGRAVRIDSPRTARALGIGTVQQHATLIPTLTVAENLLLGDGAGLHRCDRRVAAAGLAALCAAFGASLDPAARAGTLSLGEQQLAEIFRALWHGSRVLVLDEPTAMLTPVGVRNLLGILRRLTAEGTAVLFITHKLDEALAVADRITVLRQGRVVGNFPREAEREALLAAMFGASLRDGHAERPPVRPAGKAARSVLDVENLSVRGAVDGIALSVAAGEILGIAGIDGNGQTPLAEALAGQRRTDAGRILFDGEDVVRLGVAARHRRGLRYVTDDRLGEGTVGAFAVAINLLLKRIGAPPFWRRGLARRRAMAAHAAHRMDAFDIRAPGPWAPVATLSGGNAQKLLLARELEGEPRLVIYNKPTHGLDAKTQAATRRRIAAQAESGVACVLISPDLDELLALAHRIGVMRDGRLLGPVVNDGAARHRIATLMAGGPT